MLGVPCGAVMPDTAPATKIEGFKRWGGVPTFLPRPKLLDWLANEGWKTETEAFIHSFADTEVMAGPGGVGAGLVQKGPRLGPLRLPFWGGGFVGGAAGGDQTPRAGVQAAALPSRRLPSVAPPPHAA